MPSTIAHSSDKVIVAMKVTSSGQRSRRSSSPDAHDLAAVDQSPCHEKQQRRNHRKRQIARQRRNKKQNCNQKDRRADRSKRSARTRYDIDTRAVERTAGRIRREKRAGEIRQALADELLIAVELVAVLGRKRARDRNRLGQAPATSSPALRRTACASCRAKDRAPIVAATRPAVPARSTAPATAARIARSATQRPPRSRHPQASRESSGSTAAMQALRQIVSEPTSGALGATLRQLRKRRAHVVDDARATRQIEPKKRTDLTVDDQDCRAGGKADDHRVRHERRSDARHAQGQERVAMAPTRKVNVSTSAM